MTSAFWGAFTLGRLLSIPVAAKVRPRWILFGDLAGGALSLILILFFTRSALALWIGTVFLGLSLASVFPTIFSMAERRMTLTGKVTSWFFVGASSGGMFFPWLMGQIFEAIKPSAILFVLIGNLVAAFIFYLVLMLVSSTAEETESSSVS
jgi:FHS family Na+ dependent glucose MFS transporter 1